MSSRLWVISRFYAEETGTGLSITRVAEGLAKHFRVNVLCGHPDYVVRSNRAPTDEVRNGVSIHRCRGTGFNNNSLLLKLLDMLATSCTMFINAIVRVSRNDQVLIVNLPPTLPFLAVIACFLRRARCCLLVHDVYPESLVIAGVISRTSIWYRLFDSSFARLYRHVEEICVLGRDMATLVARKLGKHGPPITVIPNCTELETVFPLPRGPGGLLTMFGIEDKFVVKYAGHMGRTHGFEYLLPAIEQMASEEPDVHFLFVGNGPRKAWLEETVFAKGLKNTTVVTYLPRQKLNESVNACDVAIVSLAPGMTGVSVPGRIYDLLAAGKPIIAVCEPASELGLVVHEESVGWVVPPGRPSGIVQSIKEAKRGRDELGHMSVRARRAAESKYSLQRQVEAFVHVIERLKSPRTHAL